MTATAHRAAAALLAASALAGLSAAATATPTQAMPCRDCGGDPAPPPPHTPHTPTPPPPTPTPPPPPPTPQNSPTLAIDTVRQNTDFANVHVVGWVVDADSPTTSLMVDVLEDGQLRATVTAEVDRPDLAASMPAYGGHHGFDVVIPAPNGDHTITVNAHNIGSGQDTTLGRVVDRINGFDANTLTYDLLHAKILAASPYDLRRFDYTNSTTKDQSNEFDLSGSTVETRGWQDTQSVKVSGHFEGGVSVPFVANGKISVDVEGSLGFQQNGQIQTTKSWGWKQLVTVPAMSRVVGTSSLTEYSLSVPYSMSGNYTYVSGFTAPGEVNGVYRGVNGNDVNVVLTQTSPTGASSSITRRVNPSTSYGSPTVTTDK